MSIAIYNSYLPDVAHKEQQDRISAKGFSMGYVGSVLLLVVNLAMVMKPDLFGIEGSPDQPAEMIAMRYSFYYRWGMVDAFQSIHLLVPA
jgi:UMF1 family MFS transporter